MKPGAIDKRAVQRIVFIKSGAIGDVLMTTPLVRSVRKAFPHATLTYAVGSKSADVLKHNPNIDAVITFDVYDMLNKNIMKVLALARTIRRQKFDLAFILDKSYLAGLFGMLCGIPIRVGFDRNGEGLFNTHTVPYASVKHEIDYYLMLAKLLHVKTDGNRMDIIITRKERQFASAFFKKHDIDLKRCICIGISDTKDPGNIPSTRCWPDASYATLLKECSAARITPILLGTLSDRVRARHIEKRTQVRVISAVGKTPSINHAAALMEQCPATVVHDCGLMVVAGTTATNVIAIFGPTDPRRKAPLGSVPLWKGSSCTTCEIRGTFPYCDKHPKTAEITPESVFAQIKKYYK